MKKEELIRKIEEQANIFKSRKIVGNNGERHDLIQEDEAKYMWTAKNKLTWPNKRIGSVFNRDKRTVEKAIESYKSGKQTTILKQTIRQELYVETPHKAEMRQLARKLAKLIVLPDITGTARCTDLPVEFKPGKYYLPVGMIEIGKDKQITVNYGDISAGIAPQHLIKSLYSHMNTFSLANPKELVVNEDTIDNWVSQVGQYSKSLITFLKFIADDVNGLVIPVNFNDDAKPGLTRWFISTIWGDALQKAAGSTWIKDSWYHAPEKINGTDFWSLKCGSYPLGIADSKEMLDTYKEQHVNLRAKYAEHQLAKDITAECEELNKIASDIIQRLQQFSDMERFPGHCELC